MERFRRGRFLSDSIAQALVPSRAQNESIGRRWLAAPHLADVDTDLKEVAGQRLGAPFGGFD